MRVLIVEDDFIARKFLQKALSKFGDCEIAVDGEEAVEAFKMAWREKEPYDLICMDIMMPGINGQDALKQIRGLEEEYGVADSNSAKVIMTTAVNDPENVMEALYKGRAVSYLVKPIETEVLYNEIENLGFKRA